MLIDVQVTKSASDFLGDKSPDKFKLTTVDKVLTENPRLRNLPDRVVVTFPVLGEHSSHDLFGDKVTVVGPLTYFEVNTENLNENLRRFYAN